MVAVCGFKGTRVVLLGHFALAPSVTDRREAQMKVSYCVHLCDCKYSARSKEISVHVQLSLLHRQDSIL